MNVNKVYAALTVISTLQFGYIFVFKHVPVVGWEYVLDHWYLYGMIASAGYCLIGIFYALNRLLTEV